MISTTSLSGRNCNTSLVVVDLKVIGVSFQKFCLSLFSYIDEEKFLRSGQLGWFSLVVGYTNDFITGPADVDVEWSRRSQRWSGSSTTVY